MKSPSPSSLDRRKSSTPHYQTFPTPPPKSRGKPPASPSDSSGLESSGIPPHDGAGGGREHHHQSPLPMKQLAILAFISLAEQTALNSISPYLPEMVSTFPEVDPTEVGLYVGIIASAFALAQFATSFLWGWLSDRIGRKPVVVLGTLLTAGCFCAFGFSRTLSQAIIVQALMGLVNGNQGVISTCLGEITDRSNQSRAFVYLPVLYGIGAITGPAVGGLLVYQGSSYPYLAPNLFSAAILLLDLVLTGFFLEESLEEAKRLPPLKQRLVSLFSWLWQFTGGARSPTYTRSHRTHVRDRVTVATDIASGDEGTEAGGSETHSLISIPEIFPQRGGPGLTSKEVFNRNTIILLSTYLIFQLSNISFNSLYPVFSSAAPPTGRGLTPKEIGLSLSCVGVITILFQVTFFGKLKEKMGNKASYRAGLFGLFVAMMMMPWVGYRDSNPPFGWGPGIIWLWLEIGFVLLIKTIASVGGLTSALLLITNSASDHSVLGTLNGLAQTLSAAGRAVGPFLSGGLFSIATGIQPKGEALAWGVFGGISFIGFLASFGIRAQNLESGEWDEEEGITEEGEAEDEEHDGDVGRP